MPEKLPLAMLIELAQTKTDEATRRLGQLQNAQLSASAKLDMLVEYRQEYAAQFSMQTQGGLAASQVRNFQTFVATLDSAVEQQRTLALQASTRLSQGRSDWQSSKRRLNSFGTLADRVRQFELGVANKKEQRESDERSARQFFLRAMTLTD